jgi:hypothetical protein
MYALSVDILQSDCASDDVRGAARAVTRVLEDVIDLPIADAKILAKGTKKFGKLVEVLSKGDAVEPRLAA